MLVINRPWITQPGAGGYPLVGANPNLLIVDNGAARVANDGTPGTSYTTRRAGTLGSGIFFQNATLMETLYSVPSLTIGTGDFTLFALYELTAALTDSFNYLFGSNAAGGLAYAPRHSSTSNNAALYIAGVFKNLGVSGAPSGVYKMVLTRRSGVVYFFLNDAQTNLAVTESVGALSQIVLNSYQSAGNAGVAGGLHYLLGLEARAWSDNAVQAWMQNPWRVFGTQRIALPIVSTAPADPVLSNLRAINVGVSTATPQVDYSA